MIDITGVHVATEMTMAGGTHVQVPNMVSSGKQTSIPLEIGRVVFYPKIVSRLNVTATAADRKCPLTRECSLLRRAQTKLGWTSTCLPGPCWHLGFNTCRAGVVCCRMLRSISAFHLPEGAPTSRGDGEICLQTLCHVPWRQSHP